MNLTDKDRIVSDDTDLSLLGCQISHPNFCNVTNTVTTTEDASDFMQRLEVLAVHHEIVIGPLGVICSYAASEAC
jgi:hypothetical protein